MGLFSFFKKKKEERPAPQVLEIKCENKRVQRPISAVHLEGVDNARPNCYGNYLYPPAATFIVRGTNTTTNRKNKRTYTASSDADAIQKAETDGLAGPFEITVEPEESATERQLAYAKDLGLRIPQGACITDASALITRAEENDVEATHTELLAFLAARGWRGSAFTGYGFTLKILYNFVDNPREQIALYPYYIDRSENGLPLGNFDTAPRKDHYLAFADYVLQNPKALEHYKNWRHDKTWPKAKTWGIYKDYKEFCRSL